MSDTLTHLTLNTGHVTAEPMPPASLIDRLRALGAPDRIQP